MVRRLGETPGSGGAAELLGALGVWGPHDNIGLRQLSMTPEFPPELEVTISAQFSAVAYPQHAVALPIFGGQDTPTFCSETGMPLNFFRLRQNALVCMQAAAQALLAAPPPDPDAGHRADMTHQRVVAIDNASTTEVDDGLSVEFLPDGTPRIWVHVADPTRWVRPGEPLDLEARRRGSTMYLPTGARASYFGARHFWHAQNSLYSPRLLQCPCACLWVRAFSACLHLEPAGVGTP